jgi:hypothetical protein
MLIIDFLRKINLSPLSNTKLTTDDNTTTTALVPTKNHHTTPFDDIVRGLFSKSILTKRSTLFSAPSFPCKLPHLIDTIINTTTSILPNSVILFVLVVSKSKTTPHEVFQNMSSYLEYKADYMDLNKPNYNVDAQIVYSTIECIQKCLIQLIKKNKEVGERKQTNEGSTTTTTTTTTMKEPLLLIYEDEFTIIGTVSNCLSIPFDLYEVIMLWQYAFPAGDIRNNMNKLIFSVSEHSHLKSWVQTYLGIIVSDVIQIHQDVCNVRRCFAPRNYIPTKHHKVLVADVVQLVTSLHIMTKSEKLRSGDILVWCPGVGIQQEIGVSLMMTQQLHDAKIVTLTNILTETEAIIHNVPLLPREMKSGRIRKVILAVNCSHSIIHCSHIRFVVDTLQTSYIKRDPRYLKTTTTAVNVSYNTAIQRYKNSAPAVLYERMPTTTTTTTSTTTITVDNNNNDTYILHINPNRVVSSKDVITTTYYAMCTKERFLNKFNDNSIVEFNFDCEELIFCQKAILNLISNGIEPREIFSAITFPTEIIMCYLYERGLYSLPTLRLTHFGEFSLRLVRKSSSILLNESSWFWTIVNDPIPPQWYQQHGFNNTPMLHINRIRVCALSMAMIARSYFTICGSHTSPFVVRKRNNQTETKENYRIAINEYKESKFSSFRSSCDFTTAILLLVRLFIESSVHIGAGIARSDNDVRSWATKYGLNQFTLLKIMKELSLVELGMRWSEQQSILNLASLQVLSPEFNASLVWMKQCFIKTHPENVLTRISNCGNQFMDPFNEVYSVNAFTKFNTICLAQVDHIYTYNKVQPYSTAMSLANYIFQM